MSEQQAHYTVQPLTTAASVDEMNDGPQPDVMIVQETVRADEEAAQTEGEAQPSAEDAPQLAAETIGELQANIAARDSEIATLKARLAEAEQRAALPPLAGNPAVSDAPAEAHGYDLIRKAIESGQMQFGF